MRWVGLVVASLAVGCFAPGSDGSDGRGTESSSGVDDGPEADSTSPVTSVSQGATDDDSPPGDGTDSDTTTGVGDTGSETSAVAGTDDTSSSGAQDDTTSTGVSDESTDTTTSGGDSTTIGDEVTRVVIYRAPPTNGDILTAGGGITARASADTYCEDAFWFPADECTEAHALLSFNANDELRDMVANYGIPDDVPVESLSGVEIDENFSAMFDGSLENSLADAGVFAGQSEAFWTGSLADGSDSGINCGGWTSSAGAGANGAGTSANSGSTSGWGGFASVLCNNEQRLACVCW